METAEIIPQTIKDFFHAGEVRPVPQTLEDGRRITRLKITCLERGQLLKLLLETRHTPQRNQILARVKEEQQRLDVLDRQLQRWEEEPLQQNVRLIEVETEAGKVNLEIATLDALVDPSQKREEGDVPVVVVPGWANEYRCPMTIAIALAMEGKRVHIVSLPEHGRSQVPEDWGKAVSQRGDFSLHAEAVNGVIQRLIEGKKMTDLLTFSMGGPIGIQAATQKNQIRHLLVINPSSFVNQSMPRLVKEFLKEGLLATKTKEGRIQAPVFTWAGAEKTDSGRHALLETGKLTSRQVITGETLNHINIQGHALFILGSKDQVTQSEKTKAIVSHFQEQNPAGKIHLYWIKEMTHNPYAYGLAQLVTHPEEWVSQRHKEIEVSSLPTSRADVLSQSILTSLTSPDAAKINGR